MLDYNIKFLFRDICCRHFAFRT